MRSTAFVSLVCAFGNAIAFWAHLWLQPPPRLKSPVKTKVFGRWTFLTVQSNVLLTCYHSLRFVWPECALAKRGFPLAFTLGVGLTLLYYGLDHFVALKRADDRAWMKRGYPWIPLACHLEHGLGLPLAVYDALHGGHGGQSTQNDVFRFIGGYAVSYLATTLITRRCTGEWVYPIFDAVQAKLGKAGFWALAIPATLFYFALGHLGRHIANGRPSISSINLL